MCFPLSHIPTQFLSKFYFGFHLYLFVKTAPYKNTRSLKISKLDGISPRFIFSYCYNTFIVVWSLNCVRLFVTPWTAACQLP